jgi:hypothetical protein
MKIAAFIFLFGIFCLPAFSQKITASKPARLQVYVMTTAGEQAVMSSESLTVNYDQLKMTGELRLETLMTDEILLRNLVDSAIYDRITFSAMLPEGQFVFQSTLNSEFSVETEFFYGELSSRILINYNISNSKTSISNTFEITCTGSISLKDNLGIIRETGLEDKVSFQYFQNVQTKSY